MRRTTSRILPAGLTLLFLALLAVWWFSFRTPGRPAKDSVIAKHLQENKDTAASKTRLSPKPQKDEPVPQLSGQIPPQAFLNEMRCTEELARELRLTPEEVKSLNELFAKTEKAVQEKEFQRFSVKAREKGATGYIPKIDAQEAITQDDALHAQVEAIIGAGRAAEFRKGSWNAFLSANAAFGKFGRAITLQKEPNPAGEMQWVGRIVVFDAEGEMSADKLPPGEQIKEAPGFQSEITFQFDHVPASLKHLVEDL